MPGITRRTVIVSALAGVVGATIPIAASGQQAEDRWTIMVGGVRAYLGVLPAAIVRGHPQTHPEGEMHGGSPEGQHQYHLVLALFDVASGKRIESAQVSVKIMGLGHVGGTRLDLEAMKIANTVTWGIFVSLPGNDLYDMTFEVVLPGRGTALAFPFRYSHSNN